jgi:GDPmannose 4,6-dehydratase
MQKKALITGIDGQDGSYLAEYLVNRGYSVFGVVRSLEQEKLSNISLIRDKITLVQADLLDPNITSVLNSLLIQEEFDEVYHLAAVTFVPSAAGSANSVMQINTFSLQIILDCIHQAQIKTKVFYASSAEVYGAESGGVSEDSQPNPSSLYGLSKLLGQNIIEFYQKQGLFCCYGILFNHESIRRGKQFVTRKITNSISEIKKENLERLELGNIEAFRDWGSAKDFVEAFYMMLQKEAPSNYVIGTGKTHSVKELLNILFSQVDLDYKNYVISVDKFYREEPSQKKYANIAKIKADLGWKPKITFDKVFLEMLEFDLEG